MVGGRELVWSDGSRRRRSSSWRVNGQGRLTQRGVALIEGDDALLEFLEANQVVGREYLALEDREVLLDLIEPTRVHWRMHHEDARVTCAELFGGAFAAMR